MKGFKTVKKKIPIYNFRLNILIGSNFNRIIKKYNIDLNASEYSAFVFQHNGRIYVVIDPKQTTSGIIAHEANHVVSIIYSEIRARRDGDNDEPESYLLTWVVDQIHRAING